MADSTTIARPYAKAIFEYALAEKKLSEWSEVLALLAEALASKDLMDFIQNPTTNDQQQLELIMSLVTKLNLEEKTKAGVNNLLSLLAENRRLSLLPDIKVLYDAHKAEQEKTVSVDVVSYSELNKKQLEQLEESLSQRLEREVTLRTFVDPTILGGAIITAGDLVIDGSVRGKLNKLSAGLTA